MVFQVTNDNRGFNNESVTLYSSDTWGTLWKVIPISDILDTKDGVIVYST